MGLKTVRKWFGEDKNLKIFTVFFILASTAFLFLNAKYGFSFNDEPFCVTLGQRLFSGDALFYDEWHGTQNFGAVMLPFYALFRIFHSSNEGILLFLRYCYCSLWLGTCLYVYFTLNKKYKSSILVFAYLIFFAPHDYMTISYNSIGLMATLILCCIMYRIPSGPGKCTVLSKIFFSFFWIITVLCSPLMAVAYVLSLIAVIVINKNKKISDRVNKKVYFKNLYSFYLFSGIITVIAAAIYISVFVLLRADMSHVIKSIGYILNDPEHQSESILDSLIIKIYPIFLKNHLFFIAVLTSVGLSFIKKVREKARFAMFFVCAVLFSVFQLIYAVNPGRESFNYHMLNISLLGIVAFILLENKPCKLFGIFFGFGLVYTIFNTILSNTGIMSVSTTMTVGGVCGIICIILLCRELKEQYKESKVLKVSVTAAVLTVILIQLCSTVHIRINRSFWDGSVWELTETVGFGASKGLCTTQENLDGYEDMYKKLTYLMSQTDTKGKTLMSCTFEPIVYLDADLEIEAFSAWMSGYDKESLNERVLEYQALHGGDKPDLVFCYSENDILPFLNDGYGSIEYEGSYLFILKE
ncbi:MAG: hypothetical protein IJZ94_00015 [Clostridia bacterium]|nr:hypothetical protein [Clostridia bacterium]